MTRLFADRRGAAGLLVGAALPLLLGAGALAVDLGSAALDVRRLQGMADAAALAAAADPVHARERGEAAVAAAGWDREVLMEVRLGRYDPRLPTPNRFADGAAPADAVRVTLRAESPTYLARIFGRRSVAIARTATAAQQRLAAFSIGGRLAALDGGMLNAMLSALGGGNVALSLLDYEGLAAADLDAARVAGILRARLGMGGTYAEVLGTRAPAGEVLAAMADAADGPVRSALQRLAAGAGAGALRLGDLLDLGLYMAQASGGEGLVRVNALAAAVGVLRGSGARTVSFEAGPARVLLALGGGAEPSPWIGVSDAGATVVRTAQARVYLRLAVAPVPGLPAGLEVPLFAEAARAEARLKDVACPAPDRRSVVLEARPGPASAAIAEVPEARLADFTRAVPLSDARLLRLPLVEVDARAVADAGGAEPWQPLTWDDAATRARETRTVAGSRPLSGIAQTLARDLRLTTRVAGVEVPATAATRAVAAQLALAAPALDALLALVTGAAGLRLGEADARVTGVRCGAAALVG